MKALKRSTSDRILLARLKSIAFSAKNSSDHILDPLILLRAIKCFSLVDEVRENLWPYLSNGKSGVRPRRHARGISKSATATKKCKRPRLLIIKKSLQPWTLLKLHLNVDTR
jgi:hypothetical protein